jgi:hypothetical protein
LPRKFADLKKAIVKALQSLFLDSVARSSMDLDALLQQWNAQGFAVLPEFYSDAQIDAAQAALQSAWNDAESPVVVDDLATGQRQCPGAPIVSR